MIFYIPFGDWSNDCHGKYENVLVEAPSMESLLIAENKIKAKYGDNFFKKGFANGCCESLIDEEHYQIFIKENLITENSSLERLSEDTIEVDLDIVIELFVGILNNYGAGIKILEQPFQINNWTCKGFETVGYGLWVF